MPEEALDQYEAMKGKLGTNQELEKMTRGFVRLAKKVRLSSFLDFLFLPANLFGTRKCSK